jgi:hypothetical protein
MPNGPRGPKPRGKKRNNQRRATGPVRRGRIPSTFQPPARFARAYFGYGVYATMTEAAAVTGAIYQFRLNSVYDPDFTSAGSTAQGYSAYSSLYSTFRVYRVRAMVRFYGVTSGTTTVGYVPGLNSTVTANYAYLHAQPFAVSSLLQGNTGGAASVHTFNSIIDLPKVCGVTSAQYKNDMDFAHSAGSNPVRPVFLTLFMNGHTTGSAQTVGFEIRLVYDVELSQPLDTIVS